MKMNFLIELIGVIGLVTLLVSLIINIKRSNKKKLIQFYSLQLFGASLLCLYALINSIQIFFILQGVFVIVSAYFVYEIMLQRKKIKE